MVGGAQPPPDHPEEQGAAPRELESRPQCSQQPLCLHFIFRTDVSIPPQHHLTSQSAHNAIRENFLGLRARAVPGTALMFLFTFSYCIPPMVLKARSLFPHFTE